MHGVKTLTPERIAEIKAFKTTDFSDCPVLTKDELEKLRPRHPEYFRPVKKAVHRLWDRNHKPLKRQNLQILNCLYNAILRDVMLRNI